MKRGEFTHTVDDDFSITSMGLLGYIGCWFKIDCLGRCIGFVVRCSEFVGCVFVVWLDGLSQSN